jgi:hypothetical protein
MNIKITKPAMPSRLALGLTLAVVVLAGWAAQAASPNLGTILPRGGQRGTDVELTFSGERLDDAVDLFFHAPGITLKSITPESAAAVKAVVTIARSWFGFAASPASATACCSAWVPCRSSPKPSRTRRPKKRRPSKRTRPPKA